MPNAIPLHIPASILTLLALAGAWLAPAHAQQSTPTPPVTAAAKPVQLTPEELKEKELRKACKVEICAAFHARKPGPDIGCAVLKTWRKEQLAKMVEKAKVSWPWGAARCSTDIKLPRAGLIKAMTEPQYVLDVPVTTVTCELDRTAENKYAVKFDFAPKVTFEKGKAVKAKLGWGKIEAPMLAKTALWSATATDNTFNVLQGSVVEDINDFITNKCREVEAEWKAK